MNIRSVTRLENVFMVSFMAVIVGFPIVTIFVMDIAQKNYGLTARAVAGIAVLVGYVFVALPRMYRLGYWLHQKHVQDVRENYTGVYRFIVQPTEDQIVLVGGEPITLGDYGWQTKYLYGSTDLIYLEGLTSDWGYAWMAGFRPEQIEYIGQKPICQYDWIDFDYDGEKPVHALMWDKIKPQNANPYPIQTETILRGLQYPTLA